MNEKSLAGSSEGYYYMNANAFAGSCYLS